jgi:hypothetical protein
VIPWKIDVWCQTSVKAIGGACPFSNKMIPPLLQEIVLQDISYLRIAKKEEDAPSNSKKNCQIKYKKFKTQNTGFFPKFSNEIRM